MQRVVPVALLAVLVACLPVGNAGQGGLVPGGAATPAARLHVSYVEGTVYAPGTSETPPGPASGSESYRVATFAPSKAVGALVYLSGPDEKPYFDASGHPLATTADEQGRFRLPVEPGKPLVVTAITSGDRRLSSFATLPSTGAATVDVSLESTYATEFLRRYADRAGRSLADFGNPAAQGEIGSLKALTRDMLERGQLDPDPDLTAAEIPALVDRYLIAIARFRDDLSDRWATLLGFRPLAVTTLEDSAAPGFVPTALAVDPGTGRIFVASFNSTGVRITEPGHAEPLFRRLARDGFIRITALEVGPDGRVYFAEQIDRKLGAALAWNVSPPEIRLFRIDPASREIEEVRLQVPPELGPYLADSSRYTHIEPSAIAWHGGKLYMADIATGLIYEFEPRGTSWPGRVFAGLVVDGRPQLGNATGPRLGGAAFGGLTHLVWQGAELFFPDTERSVIRAIGADGQVRLVAGVPATRGFSGDGGPPLAALFDYPQGLAFDDAGRLFVADSDNARIRVIESGRVRTVVGGGQARTRDGDALDVSVGAIRGLHFDADGNLLFTDDETAKVRKLWLQHGL